MGGAGTGAPGGQQRAAGTETGSCRSARKKAKEEGEIPDPCYSFGQVCGKKGLKTFFNFFFFFYTVKGKLWTLRVIEPKDPKRPMQANVG